MAFQKNMLVVDDSSDDEPISENDYLTSVLGIVNGYCKLNIEVPQINLFYTSDNLLPINAKINNSMVNEMNENIAINTSDYIANTFKNVVSLKANESLENMEDVQSSVSNNDSIDEFQIYSKPSYSDDNRMIEKKEDIKRLVSPKNKRKKTKYNKMGYEPSIVLNQTSAHGHVDQNTSSNYINHYKNTNFQEKLEDRLSSKQDRELRKNQTKVVKNYIGNVRMSRSQALLIQQNSGNEIQNDSLPPQSQCPLCFGLYPTSDIEVHASGCSI